MKSNSDLDLIIQLINHALISLTEKLKNYLDSSHFVAGVFVDLEKAFDTVNHKILCEKLNYYGLRGRSNQLLSSYLENCKQYVSIDDFDSETKSVICSVLQGSFLGPLLFLIFINDFRYSLSKTECHHFADDTFITLARRCSLTRSSSFTGHVSLPYSSSGLTHAW